MLDAKKFLGAPWPKQPTKRLALLVCAEHWEWVATNHAADKSKWPMLQYLKIPLDCACCWYDVHHGDTCLKCPLLGRWANSKTSLCTDPDSPYGRWLDSYDTEAAASISRLAYQVLHEMYSSLHGRNVKLEIPFTDTKKAYVAAIDYSIGLTIKYRSGQNAICIDRSRATYKPSDYMLPNYDRDFGLLVQGICRGQISIERMAETGFKLADKMPNKQAIDWIRISSSTCAFE